jgi:hypothetical protein
MNRCFSFLKYFTFSKNRAILIEDELNQTQYEFINKKKENKELEQVYDCVYFFDFCNYNNNDNDKIKRVNFNSDYMIE